jgi:hypothetical protein
LPGFVFSVPGQEPACTPLVDKTSYWETSGSLQAVAAYLVANAPSWIQNEGSGGGGNVGEGTTYSIVFDTVRGSGWNSGDQLVFVIADLTDGSVGIRVDAEVIPPGSACISSSATLLETSR